MRSRKPPGVLSRRSRQRSQLINDTVALEKMWEILINIKISGTGQSVQPSDYTNSTISENNYVNLRENERTRKY